MTNKTTNETPVNEAPTPEERVTDVETTPLTASEAARIVVEEPAASSVDVRGDVAPAPVPNVKNKIEGDYIVVSHPANEEAASPIQVDEEEYTQAVEAEPNDKGVPVQNTDDVQK